MPTQRYPESAPQTRHLLEMAFPRHHVRVHFEPTRAREGDRTLRAVLLGMFERAPRPQPLPQRTGQSYSSGMMPFDWFEDPAITPRPPPIEPNWRKVLFALAATAIVIGLALAVGAVIR